jgi:hypothetical protein
LEKTRKDLRTVDVPNESGTESFECVIVWAILFGTT